MMTNKDYFSRTKESRDNWSTPFYFFNLLDKEIHREYGEHFSLDPCASKENRKCYRFYSKEINGLTQNWSNETVFVNPPFSDNESWIRKCYEEGQRENTIVVAIIPSRTDTQYFHDYCMKAHEIWFCKGRINFLTHCDICNRLTDKTIKYKEKRSDKAIHKRVCQDCYTVLTGINKTGNGSTFPLMIIIFKKTENNSPKIRTFYHKKQDLAMLKNKKLTEFMK